MDKPLVSIITLVYNHAPFIRQCIESILMQKTTFPFELLIHDDASTDGSADIIREYEAHYPNILKPVYQKENQRSQGKSILTKHVYPKIKGKYVAMCDGDDYWIDPLKLQKQVDFLESHLDYSICGGQYYDLVDEKNEIFKNIGMLRNMKNYPQGRTITLDKIFDDYILWLLTVCFKKEVIDEMMKIEVGRDDVIYAVALEMGKGFVFPDYFGVYRLHKGGIWTGTSYQKRMETNEKLLTLMYPHFYKKSKSFRKWYYRDITCLRFIELANTKNLLKVYFKIISFTFSGSMDTFSYRLIFFFKMSFKYFIRFVKKSIGLKKISV